MKYTKVYRPASKREFQGKKSEAQKLAKETGIDEATFRDQQHFGQNTVQLPVDLFLDEESSMDFDDYGNPIENYSVLQGNLSSFWDQV